MRLRTRRTIDHVPQTFYFLLCLNRNDVTSSGTDSVKSKSNKTEVLINNITAAFLLFTHRAKSWILRSGSARFFHLSVSEIQPQGACRWKKVRLGNPGIPDFPSAKRSTMRSRVTVNPLKAIIPLQYTIPMISVLINNPVLPSYLT